MGLAARIYNRVPNDGLRRRGVGGGLSGGICSSDPDKDLFSIPIEQGGEVCPESVLDAQFYDGETYQRQGRTLCARIPPFWENSSGACLSLCKYYQQRHSDVLPNTRNLHLDIAQFNAGARMLGDKKH